jgi:endoglucanase
MNLSAIIFTPRKLILLILATLTYNLFGCGSSDYTSSSDNKSVVLPDSNYSDLYGWNDQGGLQQTQLGRGLNLGNYLEAPSEGEWTEGRLLVEEDLQRIADAGFKTVRIPVRWSAHAKSLSPYTIDASFMARVKEVIGWANSAGLKVVLNVHHYTEMMDDPESQQEGHIQRLLGIWQQISEQFPLSEYSQQSLIFELLNEPNGRIDYADWNNIIARVLNVIWVDMSAQQNNGSAQRTVMIGTANWGHPDGLTHLSLPKSVNADNTIITIHYYEPFHFTHQGAEWVDGASDWIGTPWLGTKSDQAPLIALFDRVTSWNAQADRGFEIFMGEFGVYSAYSIPSQQKAWAAFIAREAEKRNISWAYWEYSSSFGVYDPSTGQWRPQLIEALIPVK